MIRWSMGAAIGIVVLLSLSFQNCAESLDLSEVDQESFGDSMPFAYEAKLDTIGFMSCTDMGTNYDRQAYFTFRVGAFDEEKGGVRLSDAFLNATKTYSNDDRVALLQDSAKHAGAQIQMAIRKQTDFRETMRADSSLIEDRDYFNFLNPLDTSEVTKAIVRAAGRNVTMVNSSGLSSRTFDGSLRFNEIRSVDNVFVVNKLLNEFILALTYTGSGVQNQFARSPADLSGSGEAAARSAYGVGYRIRLSQPQQFQGAESMSNRILTQVTEAHLEQGKSSKGLRGWTCSPNLYTFKIVRSSDVAGICNTINDNPTTVDQQRIYDKIRRVLPAEDWYVDLNNRCIVPKKYGKCYGEMAGETTTNYSIMYNPPPTSIPNCKAFDAGSSTNTNLCPHYFSMCFRN